MKRVTICRAKCPDVVTLKVLPTSCFHYSSEEKSTKFLNAKNNVNKIDMGSSVESVYKLHRSFLFGIWTCAKLKNFFGIQDVRYAAFPLDECI